MSVVTVSHVEKFYGNQGNITQALNDIYPLQLKSRSLQRLWELAAVEKPPC